MAVYVWKPRLLAAVVTLLAAGAGTAAVIATTGDGGEEAPGIEVPATERTFYPSEEELEKIRAIIDADGRVAKVNRGQPYEIVLAVGEERSDGSKKVRVDVVWEKPVTSSGPWVLDVCRGMVLIEGESVWNNLRSVSLGIDLSSSKVRAIAPGLAASELGAAPDDTAGETDGGNPPRRILEQPDGWNLEAGKAFKCPEGFEDD